MSKEKTNFDTRAGYQKQSLARLAAVQAVFEIHQGKGDMKKIISHYLEEGATVENQSLVKFEKTLFETLVEGTWEYQAHLDQLISDHLSADWRLERLDKVLQIILQVAIYELSSFHKISSAIIISEYVRLTDAFLEEKQASFVNKILDMISKKVRDGDTLI